MTRSQITTIQLLKTTMNLATKSVRTRTSDSQKVHFPHFRLYWVSLEVKVSKSRNTKSAQKPEPAKYSDNHRNKSAPAHRVQSSNNIIHGTHATYQPRQYSSAGNIAREITRTNYEQSVSIFSSFGPDTIFSDRQMWCEKRRTKWVIWVWREIMYSQITKLGHKWQDQPLNNRKDLNVDTLAVFTRFVTFSRKPKVKIGWNWARKFGPFWLFPWFSVTEAFEDKRLLEQCLNRRRQADDRWRSLATVRHRLRPVASRTLLISIQNPFFCLLETLPFSKTHSDPFCSFVWYTQPATPLSYTHIYSKL